jgi:hypothetical protein
LEVRGVRQAGGFPADPRRKKKRYRSRKEWRTLVWAVTAIILANLGSFLSF